MCAHLPEADLSCLVHSRVLRYISNACKIHYTIVDIHIHELRNKQHKLMYRWMNNKKKSNSIQIDITCGKLWLCTFTCRCVCVCVCVCIVGK